MRGIRGRIKKHLSSNIPIPFAARLQIARWRIQRFVQYGRQTRPDNEAFALRPMSPAAVRVLNNVERHKTTTRLPIGYLHIVLGLLDESQIAELLLPRVTTEDVLETVRKKRTQGQLL